MTDFSLNTDVNSVYVTNPHIAQSESGLVVITWEQAGTNGKDIYAQVFNADGTALTDVTVINDAAGDQTQAEVAFLADGNLVFGWNTGTGVVTQHYELQTVGDTTTLASTDAVQTVDASAGSYYNSPDIEPLPQPDGGYVVSWYESASGYSQAAIYDADGSIRVSAFDVGGVGSLRVTAEVLSNGNILFVYDEIDSGSGTRDIFGKIYDANGGLVSDLGAINTATAGIQKSAQTTAFEDGGFAVSWRDDEADVTKIRIYETNGTSPSSEITVNGIAEVSDIVQLASGNILVAWKDVGDNSKTDIFGVIYDPDGNALSNTMTLVEDVDLNLSRPDIEALDDGSFIVVYNGLQPEHQNVIQDPTFNHLPVAGNVDLGSMNEDGSLVITEAELLANSSDADDDGLSVISVSVDGANGSIVDNGDGTWTYTPVADLNGDDIALNFTVSDGIANDDAVAVVDIVPVNDAAVIAGDVTGSVTEDSGVDATGTLTASDVDNVDNSFIAETLTGTYGELVIDAGGNWSYDLDDSNTALDTLDDGETLSDSITVQSEDGTSQVIDITVNGADEGSPVVLTGLDLRASSDSGTSSTDNLTNVTTPTFRISFTDGFVGDTVELYSGSTLKGSATLTAGDISNGYVDITASTFSSDGDKAMSASSPDGSGTPSLTIDIDTTHTPSLSVTIDLKASSDSGSSSSDNITNDTTPTVTGTVTAGATVKIYDGSTFLGNATVSGTTWTYTIGSGDALSDGTQSIKATATISGTDNAGNSGSNTKSATQTMTIDTVAPSVTVQNGSATEGSNVNVSVTISDLNDIASTSLSGSTAFSKSGNDEDTSITFNAPNVTSDTNYSSTLFATDKAGNTGSDGFTWTSEANPDPKPDPDPDPPVITKASLEDFSGDPTISIGDVNATGSSVSYGLVGLWSSPTTLVLSQFSINSSNGNVYGSELSQNNIIRFRLEVSATNSGGTDTESTNLAWYYPENSQIPPLVIDLDGDGVELISPYTSTVSFDMDSDGSLEQVGWAAADDGFLALDRDGNGTIDDGSEISFIGDLAGANTDLEGLTAYDSDGDGYLTANDDDFGDFLIWQDANQNGISEVSELSSLSDLGISSIDLNVDENAVPVEENGNIIVQETTVTFTDGTTTAADSFLGYREYHQMETIAVDLGGDGVTFAASSLNVDIIGNGETQALTLVGGSDAMLVFDFDGNGNIDDGWELGLGIGEDGLVPLLDDDRGGVLDANDDYFDVIHIWQDVNENGQTDAGELSSLADFGIVAITTDTGGNLVFQFEAMATDTSHTLAAANLGQFAL